jgi:hypothetical protein
LTTHNTVENHERIIREISGKGKNFFKRKSPIRCETLKHFCIKDPDGGFGHSYLIGRYEQSDLYDHGCYGNGESGQQQSY